MSPLQSLVDRLHREAETLRKYRDDRMADVLEEIAGDLLHAIRQEDEEILSLQEASAISGYSADHLGRLVREEKIPNAGRKNAPAVRRGDLPMKPGMAPPKPTVQLVGTSREQIARAVVNSE